MSAYDYFADVRKASAKVEQCQRIINELKGGSIPPALMDGGHGSGDHSDPTAAAFFRSVYLMDQSTRQRDVCTVIIGEALQLIAALRTTFGDKADVLELYYIDLCTWRDIAERFGIAESTARMWRDDLFLHIDTHPNAYIMAATYEDIPLDVIHC